MPPGVDIEVVQALQQNPKLRQAVESELAKADHVRQQYAQATHVAAQAAVASILGSFPELQGLSGEQIPIALQMMQAQNPQRHAEVTSHLQRAEQIHKMHEQAKVQQAQILQAQIQYWSHGEDQKVDRALASEPPETVRAVKDNLLRVAQDHYGIDPAELRQAFATTPILRAAPFQKMLYSLVKTHLLQEQAASKRVPATIPNVQRPGVVGDRPTGDEVETSRAYQKFMKNPDPRSAAAFILAKRSASKR